MKVLSLVSVITLLAATASTIGGDKPTYHSKVLGVLAMNLPAHGSDTHGSRCSCTECRTQVPSASTTDSTVAIDLELLKHSDPDVRQSGAWSLGLECALGRISPRDSAVIGALAEAAKDPIRRVREEAVYALMQLRDRGRASAVVLQSLQGPEIARIARALHALQHSGADATPAMPALVEMVKDARSHHRLEAARTLGKIGPEARESIPVLVEVLRDYRPRQRRMGPCYVESWYDVARCLVQIGPEAVPRLIEALIDPKRDARHRASVAYTLGEFGPAAKQAVPALLEALNDKTSALPYYAGQSLQKIDPERAAKLDPTYKVNGLKQAEFVIGMNIASYFDPVDRELVPALIEALGERPLPDNWQERGTREVNLASALGAIGPDSLPALRRATTDPDPSVRGWAAFSLGIICQRYMRDKAEAMVPTLLEVLKDDDPKVRAAAAAALALIGVKRQAVVSALTEMFGDTDSRVRAASIRALGSEETLPRPAIKAVVSALEDGDGAVRQAAVEALAKAGADGVPALLKVLNHDDPVTRRAAADALVKTAPQTEEAIAALIQALRDPDAQTRERVAWAVGRAGPAAKNAVPVLVELLQDREAHVWFAAALALEQIGPAAKAAVSALTEMLKDRDADARARAANTLGAIGPGASVAVPALMGLLKDDNGWVRGCGVRALGGIGPGSRAAIAALSETAHNDPAQAIRQDATEALKKIGR